MAVVVGPYQRIVAVNWLTDFGYIIVEMRLVYYGSRYTSSCSEPVEPGPQPDTNILISFSSGLELKPSAIYPSGGGIARVERFNTLTSDGVISSGAVTVSGLPSIGSVTVSTDGYEFLAEMILENYDSTTIESAFYQYVQANPTSSEIIPGFEQYNKSLSLDWVYTYPTRLSGPFCLDRTASGDGIIVGAFIDTRGTSSYPDALPYRTEYARKTLDFSGLSVTPTDTGKTYNAYAAWIPSQTGGNEKAYILCKPTD